MIVTMQPPDAFADLIAELEAAGLPTSDIAEPHRRFFRFEDDGGLVGYGGIEGIGDDRLLRSLIVTPARRRNGLGGILLAALERAAANEGARALYLLTTTATPFFQRHGYAVIDRADTPSAIASSTEYQSLCPASAAILSKRII